MNGSDALAAVPREPFIPDEIFVRDADGWLVPLDRRDDPERWQTHVSADEPVVTRTAFDPAFPEELCDASTGRGVVATSSSSAPHIMAYLIDMMALRPGMRVLEVGTGTGYNAAVLAHIVGPENVTSIEIDPVAADRARRALEQAGYPVRVITGDGAQGYPPTAPYDRVVVTASALTVPYAWVEQTTPGGMILIPWAPSFHPEWPLCRLTVRSDGVAEGRFVGPSPYMPLRGQQLDPAAADAAEERWLRDGRPDISRYSITVTREGQEIWLQTSGNSARARERVPEMR